MSRYGAIITRPPYGAITAAELLRRAVLCTRVRLVACAWRDLPLVSQLHCLSVDLGVTRASLEAALARARITPEQILEVARGCPRRSTSSRGGRPYLVPAEPPSVSEQLADTLGRILQVCPVGRDSQGRCLWERIQDGTVTALTCNEPEGAPAGTPAPPTEQMLRAVQAESARGAQARGFKERLVDVLNAGLLESEQDAQQLRAEAIAWETERRRESAQAACAPLEQALQEAGPAQRGVIREALLARAHEVAQEPGARPRGNGARTQVAQQAARKASAARTTTSAPPHPAPASRPRIGIEQHLEQGTFLALDVETTGSSEADRVIELGLVAYVGWRRVRDWVWRFDPEGQPINSWAYRVHGISARDLVGQRPFREHAHDVHTILSRAPAVVAHGLEGVDKRYVARELARAGLGWPEHLLEICTLAQARVLHPQVKGQPKRKHDLKTMCAQYKINLDNHHNALADAAAAGDLWCAMARRERQHAARGTEPREQYDFLRGWENRP